jgi:hypothetical protein
MPVSTIYTSTPSPWPTVSKAYSVEAVSSVLHVRTRFQPALFCTVQLLALTTVSCSMYETSLPTRLCMYCMADPFFSSATVTWKARKSVDAFGVVMW